MKISLFQISGKKRHCRTLVVIFLIGIQLNHFNLFGQNVSEISLILWKPNWDIYFGPSLVNYQIITIEDQASWTNPVKTNGTPQFDIGYHFGSNISTQVNRKWSIGFGGRLHLKGGRNGFADVSLRNYQHDKEDQYYLMLMGSAEYRVARLISLFNGLTLGYPPNKLFEKGFEWAILSGLKFQLPNEFSLALYYNQGLISVPTTLIFKRRFYSFDLSLFYRMIY